jgi:hypothetical protein
MIKLFAYIFSLTLYFIAFIISSLLVDEENDYLFNYFEWCMITSFIINEKYNISFWKKS